MKKHRKHRMATHEKNTDTRSVFFVAKKRANGV